MANEGTRKPSGANWFLWCKVDQAELARHVAEYDTIKFHRSARGAALGCISFILAVTGVAIYLSVTSARALVDVALWIVLAMFIYLGHRWALIGAMFMWTFEKLHTAITASNAVTAVMAVIWWCIFMHVFYLAFRVEQEREKGLAAAP